MARKPEEEANHWPGFVDALSTIVMVITFLLILLGLTLFIMMQKIQSDANVDVDTKVASEAMGGDQMQDQAATQEDAKEVQVSQLEQKLQQAQKEIESLKSKAEQNAVLRQDERIDTEDKLTIRTRDVTEKVKMSVASDEPVTTDGKIKVTSAAVALELDYDKDTTKLGEETTSRVGDYFEKQLPNVGSSKFEIRSIASSKLGSVSDARRKAYFRALEVRNVLLSRGIPSNRIITKVALPQPGEDDDKVIVSVKPE